jgi:hypothetical protein
VSLTFANCDIEIWKLVTLTPVRNVTFHPCRHAGICYYHPTEQGVRRKDNASSPSWTGCVVTKKGLGMTTIDFTLTRT